MMSLWFRPKVMFSYFLSSNQMMTYWGSIRLISKQPCSSHSLMMLDLILAKLGLSSENLRIATWADVYVCSLSRSCLEKEIVCLPSFWKEWTSVDGIGGVNGYEVLPPTHKMVLECHSPSPEVEWPCWKPSLIGKKFETRKRFRTWGREAFKKWLKRCTNIEQPLEKKGFLSGFH